MAITPSSSQGDWQRLMGAPRDYSEDALRGAQVADMPFKNLLEQQKTNVEQQKNWEWGRHNMADEAQQQAQLLELSRHNVADEGQAQDVLAETGRHNLSDENIRRLENATTQMRYNQLNNQFQQEQAIRQSQEQRAQSEYLHTQAVQKIMDPLNQAIAAANATDLQYKIESMKQALENRTSDQQAMIGLTKRMGDLQDDAFTNGGAQSLLAEGVGALKTDDFTKRWEALYNSRNSLVNSKNAINAKSRWFPEAKNAYDQAIAAGMNEDQAVAQGNIAQFQKAKTMGVTENGFRQDKNGNRLLTENDKDLDDPKKLFDQAKQLFKGNPLFYPKLPNGKPNLDDESMLDQQSSIAAAKVNQLVRGSNGQPGNPDAARDLYTNPNKLLGFLQGKYNPLTGQNVDQTTGQPDLIGTYFNAKPTPSPTATPTPTPPGVHMGIPASAPVTSPTPSSAATVDQPYKGPPKPPNPAFNQPNIAPITGGGTSGGWAAPTPTPDESKSDFDQYKENISVPVSESGQQPNLMQRYADMANGNPSGLFRAEAYGPSQNEYTHDTLFGPLGALQNADLAISKDQLRNFPLGSYVNVVDSNGKILRENRRVADYSYTNKDTPNYNTFELWNDEDLGHAHLVASPGPQGDDYASN